MADSLNITSASILEVSNAITRKGPKVSKETYDAHVPQFVSKRGFISPDWVATHGGEFERASEGQLELTYDEMEELASYNLAPPKNGIGTLCEADQKAPSTIRLKNLGLIVFEKGGGVRITENGIESIF